MRSLYCLGRVSSVARYAGSEARINNVPKAARTCLGLHAFAHFVGYAIRFVTSLPRRFAIAAGLLDGYQLQISRGAVRNFNRELLAGFVAVHSFITD